MHRLGSTTSSEAIAWRKSERQCPRTRGFSRVPTPPPDMCVKERTIERGRSRHVASNLPQACLHRWAKRRYTCTDGTCEAREQGMTVSLHCACLDITCDGALLALHVSGRHTGCGHFGRGKAPTSFERRAQGPVCATSGAKALCQAPAHTHTHSFRNNFCAIVPNRRRQGSARTPLGRHARAPLVCRSGPALRSGAARVPRGRGVGEARCGHPPLAAKAKATSEVGEGRGRASPGRWLKRCRCGPFDWCATRPTTPASNAESLLSSCRRSCEASHIGGHAGKNWGLQCGTRQRKEEVAGACGDGDAVEKTRPCFLLCSQERDIVLEERLVR